MVDRIQPGDRVTVDFMTANTISDAEVLDRPQDTGDTWKLRSLGGDLIEVMHFSRMTRLDQLWETDCPNCDTAIRYREGRGKVVCMHCGARFDTPTEDGPLPRRVPQ